MWEWSFNGLHFRLNTHKSVLVMAKTLTYQAIGLVVSWVLEKWVWYNCTYDPKWKKTKFLGVSVRQEESAVERKIGLIFCVTSFSVAWCEVFSSWKRKKNEIIFLNRDYFNFYVRSRNVGFLSLSRAEMKIRIERNPLNAQMHPITR